MKQRATYNTKTGKSTYSHPVRNIDIRPGMIIEDNAPDETKQKLAAKKGMIGAAKLLFTKH